MSRIEIAPGIRISAAAAGPLDQRIGLTKIQPLADGKTYRLLMLIYEIDIPLRQAATLLGVPDAVLQQLCCAGFLKANEVAPGLRMLNASSWAKHLRMMRLKPDFWSRDKNRRKYRTSIGEGGKSPKAPQRTYNPRRSSAEGRFNDS